MALCIRFRERKTAEGQHSNKEIPVEKNATLEPDFQQSQNAGGRGMSSIPLLNPILGIKLRLL